MANGKPVTVVGVALSGADAGNYSVSQPGGLTANITPLGITGSITATDKVYDATTAATIVTRTLTGVIAPDVVSLTGGTANFADKNVGPTKTVTGTGFTLSNTDAGNYMISPNSATTTASITAKPASVTFTANSRVYDGTNTATVATSTVVGKVGADDATPTGGTVTFADKNAALSKTVTWSGFSLSGTDAGNYSLSATTATATANIAQATLTISFTADNKVYDGTPAATILTRTLGGTIFGTDAVTPGGGTANFADKNFGSAKTVTGTGFTLSNTDAGNYMISPNSATTTANITKATLTISFTADNKVYDGTTVATILTRTLGGTIFGTDAVTPGGGTANFADKNFGPTKTVTGTGFTLSNTDAGNYMISPNSATTTASITERPITVTADAITKVFGNPDPSLTYQVTSGSLVIGDTFSGALVRVAGENVSIYAILQGTLSLNSNYRLTYVGANFTITARPTMTSLTSSLSLSETPVRVGLVATVASGGLIPVGSVTFFDNGSPLPSGTMGLSGTGTAVLSTTSLGLGQHVITATYTPASTNFTGSFSASNTAPAATITGPTTGSFNPIGTSFNFTGTFSDATGTTPTTAAWSFDTVLSVAGVVTESLGSGAVTNSQAFSTAGVYAVRLTVNDNVGGITMVNTIDGLDELVVVYDPSAGFVTGGGWINSPAGAYVTYPTNTLTGKANFGFVSKYKNGASTPTGETEFQFKAGDLKFHSVAYQWLVVSGPKAQYKGTGMVNGAAGYSFLLTATDGQVTGGGGVDKFRIKIWNTATSVMVYDNVLGASDDIDAANPQAIGGGSIVIHK